MAAMPSPFSPPTGARIRAEERLAGLRQERDQWRAHWAELAHYILPRRYRWLATSNSSRGGPINQRIIDETGTIAFRTLAAGMMSGITSPTRPWFKLRVSGFAPTNETSAAAVWLDECEQRMMRVFHESNFYSAMATKYFDLGVFGSSAILIYEDFDNVINCVNPCLGEFYIGNDERNAPAIFAREFVMTALQLERRFGLGGERRGNEGLSSAVQTALTNRGKGLSLEFEVCHLIEPYDAKASPVAGIDRKAKYVELYWLKGSDQSEYLELKGFRENPALCGRWDLSGNDAYGRSPGMDALPAIKQLQQQQKRKAQGIDKMVNPPLMGDIQLRNQPASTLPGGITYVANLAQNPGLKPIYTVQPDLQYLGLDIKDVQERIKTIAFNDLFLMISQLQTVRTATEIDARREEKLVMLGPVLERFENEVLDPAVNRTFQIMLRGGLFPEAPPEIQGEFIHVDYVSMLAEAQRATATSGLERMWQIGGQLGSVDPSILDVFDFEEGIREYAHLLAVPPRTLKDPALVAQLRDKRAKDQEQTALLQQTVAGAQGAKTLSQTDVGGGQNALQAMLGTGGAP